MGLYQRYLSGECVQVYQEIDELGKQAFLEEYFTEIDKVLTETFTRLQQNLTVIYEALLDENYQFNLAPEFNFEKPLHRPLETTSEYLQSLDKQVSNFGYVPLSLKYFYNIVGGVNLVWDTSVSEPIWELADPVQVASVDALLSTDWAEEISSHVDDGEPPFLALSADDLHKDNVSGAMPYAIEITKEPSIDAPFFNEPHHTNFVNYLRIVCDCCGFPAMQFGESESFDAFTRTVKPYIQPI